jgi:hypothetical protein
MTARLGTVPTIGDRVLQLEHQLAEALARIAVLEARGDAEDAVDGPAPQPLPPSWKPIKAASALVGYSPTMLRKLNDGGRASWWEYRGSRIWIDTACCPRRV